MEPLAATRPFEGLSLNLGTHRLTLAPWGEGVLELRFTTDAPLPASPAALPAASPVEAELGETPTGAIVRLPGLTLIIEKQPLALFFETPDGTPLTGRLAVGMAGDRLRLAGELLPEDAFYGLGEKPGHLNKRGRQWGMWNTDNTGPHNETQDLMYQSIPWLVLERHGVFCGLLVDDPGHTRYDLGAGDPAAWHAEAAGPGLRLFAVAGPTLDAVVTRYAALTGRMPLPPRWALGYHQSRWGYRSQDEILAIADEFRARRIPLDVIHLDIDYMDGYRVFTWHPERFPDPPALTSALARRGVRAVTIVDPGVKAEPGYPVYDACLSQGLYVRNADDTPYVGEVWPGPCVFPDFVRAEARTWWGDRQSALTEAGVAGIWNDMNEPSVFRGPAVPRPEQTMPPEARHGAPDAPVAHAEAHNLYGFFMSEAAREGLLRAQPNTRPFVITRAGYAGIQRHAMVWTGDNHALWSALTQSLPMCLNLGLSGVPFVGPDVGGFSGDTSAELLVRWTQAGALMPFFRNHSAHDTRRQEPWRFGERAEALCREAIALRYRLLPYLYGAFREAAETGRPILRPMLLAYPGDAEAAALDDQCMVGSDLLVAPVMTPGAKRRSVYFPAGGWVDFFSGEVHEGPGYRSVEAPLERLPLYVRAGAVLPLWPEVQHTGEPVEALVVRVVPGAELSGVWYDDDGESLDYARGAYRLWRFSGSWGAELKLRLTPDHNGYEGATRSFEVHVPWGGMPERATFDGEPVTGRMVGEDFVVCLPLVEGELVVS